MFIKEIMKIESMLEVLEELYEEQEDADNYREITNQEAAINEVYSDLEGEMFEWVLGQTEDPEPDEPSLTPELCHAVAEKAYELASEMSEYEADWLLRAVDKWARMTSRDVYGY